MLAAAHIFCLVVLLPCRTAVAAAAAAVAAAAAAAAAVAAAAATAVVAAAVAAAAVAAAVAAAAAAIAAAVAAAAAAAVVAAVLNLWSSYMCTASLLLSCAVHRSVYLYDCGRRVSVYVSVCPYVCG